MTLPRIRLRISAGGSVIRNRKTIMRNTVEKFTGVGSGWQVCLLGGNANNSLNAGAFYLNANNDSANSNTNIGRRLCLLLKKSLSVLTCFRASWQNTKQCPIGVGRATEGSGVK